MKISAKNKTFIFYTSAFALLFVIACSSQKNTAINRKLQNLSAHYNLIYNANVLLDEYLDGVNETNNKDFSTILPLYLAPAQVNIQNVGAKIKELDEVEKKARTVIAEKNLSNYTDDAYMLLGKTNFYQGKYYNATEYFNYVAQTYKKDHKIYLNALTWQARSYMQLKQDKISHRLLDSVRKELDSVKRNKAEALATLAQMQIQENNYNKAISLIQQALKSGANRIDKINWTYTLAQLYEAQKENSKSLAYYHKIVHSNAPFEMYFNAALSSIRIKDQLNHQVFDKQLALQKLLKDEKNADFVDQIYFEIAQDYAAEKDYVNAEKYYLISSQNSKKNQTQKALAYLKIADLSINHYQDYTGGKLYYDSALQFLPKNNFQYPIISNKSKNLSYLQKRYEEINLQDSLQKIALLPTPQREIALTAYFQRLNETKSSKNENTITEDEGGGNTGYIRRGGNSSFYFANNDAISRGFNEFKRKWGNRKWGNFWRTNNANKSDNELAQNNNPFDGISTGSDPDVPKQEEPQSSELGKRYLDSLPTTPVLLEKSNQKIITALLEMGSFYQQVIKDNKESIKIYQELLRRFPAVHQLDRVYYSLYLAYQDIDKSKSEDYKNSVLKQFSNSVFAKTILDPNYSVKQNELDAKLKLTYETIFDKFQNKQYKEVIDEVNKTNQRFPGNQLSAQFDYLKALAIGHTDNLEQLTAAFKNISSTFKNDKLIKPLVDQHLAYINQYPADFKKSKTALTESKPDDLAFVALRKQAPRRNEPIIATVLDPYGNKKITYIQPSVEEKTVVTKPVEEKVIIANKENKTAEIAKRDMVSTLITQKTTEKTQDTVQSVLTKEITKPLEEIKNEAVIKKDTLLAVIAKEKPPYKDDLFSNTISNTYYFVVAVNTYDFSLSSSRFGIGQFNRGNYSGENLRHSLKELDKDQLIFVGDFASMGDAKTYQERILQQITNVMKISNANYRTFVISKENFEKITDRSTLDRYRKYLEYHEQQK